MKTNLISFNKEIRDSLNSTEKELVIGFSNKNHGQMKFGDGVSKERVLANRESFLAELGIRGKGVLVRANQVHSNRNYLVGKRDLLSGANRFTREIEIKNTDGLITDIDNIWLTITVADCLPILIWHSKLKLVAAVHAGWQGTLAQIALKAVDKINDSFDININDLYCWIGPSIGPSDFEVKNDVYLPFRKRFFSQYPDIFISKSNKKYIDLWQLNKFQLIEGGMSEDNIYIDGKSTYSNNDYFSFRDGEDGRMIGLVGINS
jgi:hypothetical protein